MSIVITPDGPMSGNSSGLTLVLVLVVFLVERRGLLSRVAERYTYQTKIISETTVTWHAVDSTISVTQHLLTTS